MRLSRAVTIDRFDRMFGIRFRGISWKNWKDCYFETGVFFVFFFSLLIKRYLIRSWIVLYKKRNIPSIGDTFLFFFSI